MFKVNNKNIRTTSVTCSSVSIDNFVQIWTYSMDKWPTVTLQKSEN